MDDELTHGGVRVDPDQVRWMMWGEVDAAVQTRVAPTLATHLRQTADEPLTVDMTAVTFLDSGGLRLLYDAAAAKPTPPVLLGTPPKVLDLLKLSGVDSLFHLQG